MGETNDLDTYYEYKNILQRMLDNVPTELDKREGSVIYNALAPAAIELAQIYFYLKNNMDLCFADTAVGEYLDRLCEQIGIARKQATKAIRKGQFFKNELDEDGESYLPYEDIPLGSRFSIENVVYTVIEKIEDEELSNIYKLECETAGSIGNQYVGNLVPIDYIDNLGITHLNQIIIPGTDEEADEELRIRYYSIVKETAFGGNIADYRQKVKNMDGVGLVNIITASELNNTSENVRVVFLDSNYDVANSELVEEIQTIIDPTKDGSGVGLAPIRT